MDTEVTSTEEIDTYTDSQRPRAQQDQLEHEAQSVGDSVRTEEELPEYETVVAPREETDGPAVVYENLKDMEAAREGTLIAEAPPTYRQLFGERKNKKHTRKLTRRQSNAQSLFQTLKERLENNKLASTFVVSGTVLLLLSLPLAMIVIGGLNVNVCFSHQIPLYLLIAGFILIGEVVFQTSICIAVKRNSQNTSTYQALRMCDCLALFLFIWLLIGTYWIFTAAAARDSCPNPVDINVFVNTTVVTDSEGGTQVMVVTPSPTEGDHECSDCDSYVYSFTALVIMLQYIAVLVLLICCCSTYFKKYGR